MDFFSAMPEEKSFRSVFAATLTGMDNFSGIVPALPLVQIRENPELHDLILRNKRTWPRCLYWHGWLPALDGSSPYSSRAVGFVGFLPTSSNSVLDPILLEYGKIGSLLRTLQLFFGVLHLRYDLMSGLMGVWCAMRPRGLVAVEPGSMLWLLVLLGFVGLGDTLLCCDVLWRQVLSAASYTARWLALHSLYNGLSSGGVILALQASSLVPWSRKF